MRLCTPEDTPVGTYVYNIFAAQRKQVDENCYMRYQVYCNPHVHDEQVLARFLAIRLLGIENQPEEDQARI